ncbi:hypothetical protein [Streptomyces sp. NPDC050264]|uniref:hypothetical protein n=1 Tax=Streptomyces sp. NPDC050264 TaxID=3155038 RepID=UPI00344AD1FE
MKQYARAVRSHLPVEEDPGFYVSRTMRMEGCGVRARGGATHRWTTDGIHIYATDSRTLPAPRSYWTDSGGRLMGQGQGSGAQTWTIKPWEPPAGEPAANAYARTGLFGPLAAFL